jgi:tetratricopeptide (TPR) repeat protein
MALYDALDPPAEREQLEVVLLLGDARRKRGDMEGAEQAFARALALAEDGGYLPEVARALHKQGHLRYVQGRREDAQPLLERSLMLRDAFFGPLSAASIRPRLLLSIVLQHRGALPEANVQANLARRSFDESVPAQLRGEVLKQLARVHRTKGEWSEAIASYREARRAWESVAVPDRVELALLDVDVADCLVMQRELLLARELYDRALRLFEVETAPDDHRRAYLLRGRGLLLLEQGEREPGIASLHAALELHTALVRDPMLHAELRWELGRALGPEDAEAPTLVAAAREAFATAGWSARVAELDAWLADPSSRSQRPRSPTTRKQ